jgi:site-specific recombinase XerC
MGEAELEQMIASLGSSWLEVRARAILLTFFGSGLRESELSAIQFQDLDLDGEKSRTFR